MSAYGEAAFRQRTRTLNRIQRRAGSRYAFQMPPQTKRVLYHVRTPESRVRLFV